MSRTIERVKNNKSLMLLIFLGLFSFSSGLFGNYRVLWMAENGVSTVSISRIILVSYVVTALALPPKRLKNGILITTILKMITSTVLICLNGSGLHFLIKFVTFFNIAFENIIFSSVYPLMLNIKKDDEIYTKRESVESIADKVGFFLASFLLGSTIGGFVVDYNKCLLFSIIFLFVSFIILLLIDVEGKDSKSISLKTTFEYFNKNKVIYLYLFVIFVGSIAWGSILGLKMLTLTETIGLSDKFASYMVLGLGVLTNILAILIVKYLKFKNDYINIFFKYGFRIVLYIAIFLLNSKLSLFITIVYLLVTDVTYSFVFSGYIMNNMEEKHILVFSVLKYCINLIGDGIGVYVCGITFNMDIRYIGLAAAILGFITYMSANILVSKKRKGLLKDPC